ncbi:MAG: hypothetical protein LUF90_09455 [Rikenellaceae bacterium]|nr:hypothetical protein [Rikenellaceae bacterium]
MKKFIILLAFAGLFASCSKDAMESQSVENEVMATARASTITFSADINITGQDYYSAQGNFISNKWYFSGTTDRLAKLLISSIRASRHCLNREGVIPEI